MDEINCKKKGNKPCEVCTPFWPRMCWEWVCSSRLLTQLDTKVYMGKKMNRTQLYRISSWIYLCSIHKFTLRTCPFSFKLLENIQNTCIINWFAFIFIFIFLNHTYFVYRWEPIQQCLLLSLFFGTRNIWINQIF